MPKFRSKPRTIEAEQYTGLAEWDQEKEELAPSAPLGVRWDESEPRRPYVVTIHGQRAYIESGDWVATEPDGEHHYPIKPDIFADRYEPL